MDVVANLLAFVAEYLVFTALEIATDQIAEESVQFHSRVIGAREASAAQTAGGHAEISPVLLHHDIGCHFRSPEQRVLRLIDRKRFRNAVDEIRIVELKARGAFPH